MDKDQALEIVCRIALDWAGEYGFTIPEEASRVFNAVEILSPDIYDKLLEGFDGSKR